MKARKTCANSKCHLECVHLECSIPLRAKIERYEKVLKKIVEGADTSIKAGITFPRQIAFDALNTE